MTRIRSGVLSVGLCLLLGAVPASSGPNTLRSGTTAGATPLRSAAVRVLRPTGSAAFGVGECPSDAVLELWPPNHEYVEIDLAEVLGPATLGIEITSITQDEPVDDRGDGRTTCDGAGLGTSVAHLRAERDGRQNGRVYVIEYSAFAGACSGLVTVTVPHDRRGTPAEDDGQLHDSTEGCP